MDYVIGLAKNDVVIREIKKELEKAHQKFEKTGKAVRIFKDFQYRTKDSWSRKRRVIAKAEHLEKGSNPRFVVTSLPKRQMGAPVYLRAHVLCARRYGEPDQRATVGTLRRPHQHRDDARQPASALLFIGRLSADARLAPVRIEGYRVGSCPMRHDSFEAAQDWRTDSGHCAPGSGFAWPVVIPTRRSSHRSTPTSKVFLCATEPTSIPSEPEHFQGYVSPLCQFRFLAEQFPTGSRLLFSLPIRLPSSPSCIRA